MWLNTVLRLDAVIFTLSTVREAKSHVSNYSGEHKWIG